MNFINDGQFSANVGHLVEYYKNEIEILKEEINRLNIRNAQVEGEKEELKRKIELMKYENYKLKEGFQQEMILVQMKAQQQRKALYDKINQIETSNRLLLNEIEIYKEKEERGGISNDNNNVNECYGCMKLNEEIHDIEKDLKYRKDIMNIMVGFYNKLNRKIFACYENDNDNDSDKEGGNYMSNLVYLDYDTTNNKSLFKKCLNQIENKTLSLIPTK